MGPRPPLTLDQDPGTAAVLTCAVALLVLVTSALALLG
jgi:hypothetical protein